MRNSGPRSRRRRSSRSARGSTKHSLCPNGRRKSNGGPPRMQVAYFGTWNGGEEFFSRLAALDEREDQAREVYFYCLAMGFKGSLFRQDDQEILERIKAEQRAGIATRYRAQAGQGASLSSVLRQCAPGAQEAFFSLDALCRGPRIRLRPSAPHGTPPPVPAHSRQHRRCLYPLDPYEK